jgi:hypothetical protein
MEKLKFTNSNSVSRRSRKNYKKMEYFDKLKEIYQTHITNTDIQIKEHFEFHLNKCKNAKKINQETKDELSNND